MRAVRVAGVSVAAVALVLLTGACSPPPPTVRVPGLTGIVLDACTGAPVPNLAVAVTGDQGPVQEPTEVTLGHFTFGAANPGPSQLQVSAPGYAPLGDPATPGVAVTANPGPIQLPSPQRMAVGLTAVIYLSPSVVPADCGMADGSVRPAAVPALSGTVTDAATGAPLGGLRVSVTDPATGAVTAPTGGGTGWFSYATINPGPIQLQVSAPGHASLGDGSTPGTAPGVTVTANPGPIMLPAVQRMSIGTVVAVAL